MLKDRYILVTNSNYIRLYDNYKRISHDYISFLLFNLISLFICFRILYIYKFILNIN